MSKTRLTLITPPPFVAVCLLKLASRVAFAACLASLGLPCRAGHYDGPVYSGGSATWSPGPPGPIPYGEVGGGWGGGGSTGGSTASVSASGQITAVFTWAPDYAGDDPPDSVITTETCTASWSGYALSPPTGTCTNGLGSDEVDTSNSGPYPGSTQCSGQSNGTRYTVLAGQDTITLTCAPSANMSDSGDAFASASVNYSATLTPVQCSLGGVTRKQENDGSTSLNILIGQGCNAILSAGGLALANYQWTIGGDTFKGYVAHGTSTGGYAQVFFLTSSDLQQASPTWYWRSEDGAGSEVETVTGTADVYAGGALVGRATAHQKVTVWAPYYFCGYNARNVTIDQNASGIFWLQAGTTTQDGIDWTGQAVPPDLFGLSGAGIWAFVQTVFSTRSYTENGTVHNDPYNNLPGLDTSYPYQPDGAVMEADDSNAGWPDDDSQQSAGDAPGTSLTNSMTSVNFSDQFWTYMMYRPADIGYGCQWVPLHRIAWQWSANVNEPGGSWANWPAPYPAVLGPVVVTGDERWTVHPVWTRVVLAMPF